MQHDEDLVLVLQGGGALGAYQAGAYQALLQGGLAPQWVAGISIGAINAAIIAGNPPERRVERLRQFWNTVSSGLQGKSLVPGAMARTYFNEVSSWMATVYGIPGFFTPRIPPPAMAPEGTLAALSYYDTTPLLKTLDELVDFGLLNSGAVRLSVGTVNIATGNFRYFDTAHDKLDARHILASGALPPGFPPVEIDGQWYWDGGLVSNTPLQHVLDQPPGEKPLCIFQIDLFPARAPLPRNIFEVSEREKEIRFSSRTRMNSYVAEENQRLRDAARKLYDRLPEDLRQDPAAQDLLRTAPQQAHTLVHLIKRPTDYDTQSKDYEFSRVTVEESWEAGIRDVNRTIHHPAWINRKPKAAGITTLDLTRDAAP